MKLVTFELPSGARHIGAMLAGETRIADFTAGSGAPWARDMLALIDAATGPGAQADVIAGEGLELRVEVRRRQLSRAIAVKCQHDVVGFRQAISGAGNSAVDLQDPEQISVFRDGRA